MDYQMTKDIPFKQIQNGALILLLLEEVKTWKELCDRYEGAEPDAPHNTDTMVLIRKLKEMRDLNLIDFKDIKFEDGKIPEVAINATGLWSDIRVSLGGLRTSNVAMLSSPTGGIAVTPVFGRPRNVKEKID